ncbi:PDR/VanB family oxidoreductase [Amycolatopsis sp.]|uniref:PDR/VanB family oxidoreductase n=1 Tax=Amycolatopsis sp. TaxID=37632 RepID=UPI002BD153CC|nr:PDR/VanB family oxidoreductase [Amycolatopsis sp.]HVV09313.1 PDR/VanB family oxidoreductase [Amycolatopsis sp.]
MTDEIREVVVTSRVEHARDVVGFTFADRSGNALPDWQPGAHIDLLLPDGRVRQYSLCGSEDDGTWHIAVRNAPDGRGGSAWIHDNLNQGDVVRVRGPRNNFPLVSAPRYVFVAGGIGITPIIAMLRELERRGERNWRLTYGGRSRDSMAFLAELEGRADQVTIAPQDETGLIDIPAALGQPQIGTAVYCCGPEPLLKAVDRACRSWPPGTLRFERFTPVETDTSGDEPFEVVAERSGVTVTVPPGVSILDALADQGIHVATSCGEGVCGTCETKVLEGEVDHRDSLLTEDERAANNVMMVCCSRARCPRLVLDV